MSELAKSRKDQSSAAQLGKHTYCLLVVSLVYLLPIARTPIQAASAHTLRPIYFSVWDSVGRAVLKVREPDGQVHSVFPNQDDGAFDDVSPDGTRIVFDRRNWLAPEAEPPTLWLGDPRRGIQTMIAVGPSAKGAIDGTWSPDGQYLLIGGQYAESPAAQVAALQGLYMLLVYNPTLEYVCLLSTEQEGFTRRYRMTGDVAELRRLVLAEFDIQPKPLDERQYAALRAEIMGVYELLSGLAYKGYKAFGRGGVAILSNELSQAIASGPRRAQLSLLRGQLAFYVPMSELPRLTEVNAWLKNKLSIYEPEESFMALFFHGEGRSSAHHIREVLAPRRAYKKHQAEINALYDG